MSFEVTILGSGAALPTANRNPSAQYVVCNDRHFLIDCGEGTQNQLRKHHVKIQKISNIFISHLHGDHFFGLVGLLSSLHLLGRDQGITVYGPEGLEQIIRLQLEMGGAKLGFSLTFVVANGDQHVCLYEDKLVEVWAFPLKHRIPTNGFVIKQKQKDRNIDGERLKEDGLLLEYIPALRKGEDIIAEDGTVYLADDYTFKAPLPKSYAYCSDTIYKEDIVPYISQVDLLYHEATFLHEKLDRAKQTFHTTAKQAAEIAKLAKVKKLILGHLSARYENGKAHEEEAKPIFEAVVVVNDGDVFKV